MFSSKPFCIVLCLLCTALPARAQQPNGSRSNNSGQRLDTGYTKEWGGKTFEEWRRDLRTNPDPSYREAALLALVNFKQAPDALPDVVVRMREDHDASVRVHAAMLLRFPHHQTDRTRIIKGLAYAAGHDSQSVCRYEAAKTLLQFFCPLHLDVKEERDALKDLVDGLKSTSTYAIRDIIILTLIMAGVDPKTGPDPRVTEALIWHANFQNEPSSMVRLKAIMALGAQGRPQDPKKLQRVMDVLKMPANYKSSHPTVRIWSHVAIIALVEKVDKKDLDTIAGYLKDKDPATREQAVKALGALEEKSQAYVDDILKMLNREKVPAVRAEAAIALARLKITGPKVLNAIISMTEEDSRESLPVVWSACNALVLLGVNNAEVMRAMDKVVEHKSLEEYQKKAVQKMIEELQNPKKKTVKNAAKKPEQPVGRGTGTAQQNNRR